MPNRFAPWLALTLRIPVAIITPHRVVGAKGKLSAYRWGAERKAKLLRHEAINKGRQK